MKFMKKMLVCILCISLLFSLSSISAAAADTNHASSQKKKLAGWQTIKGKKYYYRKGVKVTGLKKIGNNKYYFNKKGVMQTGLKTVNKKKYYFDKNTGCMTVTAVYKKYLIAYNGVCYKIPDQKTGNKLKDAHRVAKAIAKCVQKKGRDIDRVQQAAFYVSVFSKRCRYTMSGPDYSEAYGVFIAKEYSCAGSTRALGMVLEHLGYQWTHANPNKYTHQWCKLKMDGKNGYADGQVGMVGYGRHFVEKR